MSKNKIFWIFAMVLIVSLPSAFAQVFGMAAQNWYYLLINALVIGAVLFILQTILVPGKSDKEKGSIWMIIVLVALLVAWFNGREGLIWKTGAIGSFFATYTWYVVLVNAFVIGVVMYFGLTLLKVNEKLTGSTEGKTAYGILLAILALILAVKIGNVWVWSQPTIQEFRGYLFGPEGILSLNGNRLFIFIGSSFLLTFFFNNFLIKGGAGGSNKVNIGLAVIMAASMAKAGMSVRSLIILAEVIFVIVLAQALETSTTKRWGTNWIVALLLIGWVSAAATYGEPYQGILAGIVGIPLSWFGLVGAGTGVTVADPKSASWWGKALVGAFIVAAIIGVVVFVFARGQGRKRLLTMGLAGLKKQLNAILGFTNMLRENPEGREPQIIKENRLLLNSLANYTTRSEITYRYWKVVNEGIAIGNDLIPNTIGKFTDPKKLRQDLIAFRSGGVESEKGEYVKGWNRLNKDVVALINQYFELTFMIYVAADRRLKKTTQFKLEAALLTALEHKVREVMREIKENHDRYDLRKKAFGAHHVLKAYKEIILNMSNVTGDHYEHPMKFAKQGAEFIGGMGYYDKSFKVEKTFDENGNPIYEVNQYGEFMDDIIAQKDVSLAQYKKPRRLKNPAEETIDHPDFIKLMQYITLDWRGLAEDIRYGLHHPKSRTVKAYIHALEKNVYPEWNDRGVSSIGTPSKQDQSFDMRALANTGNNSYLGRKKYTDAQPPAENPDPNLSSLGLKVYLKKRVELDMKDKHLAHQWLMKYPADTGAYEKVIKDGKVIVPIGGYLGQESKEEGK